MTLFNDEDDEEKAPPSALRRWLKRIFWTAFFLFLFTWFTLRMLMNLGGNSAPLREGMEELFRRTTGLHAAIGQFNYMKFYPDVSIDMGDIGLSEGKNDPSIIRIGSMKMTADFWNVVYPAGRAREFSLTGLDINEGVYFRRALHVDKIALESDGGPGKKPAFVIAGRYGADAFSGYMLMDWKKDTIKKGYFSRPDKAGFSFESAFLNFHGEMTNSPDGGLEFKISDLGFPDRLLAGRALLRRDGEHFRIMSDLKGGGSEYVSDITWSEAGGYAGSMRAPVFDTADAGIFRAITDFYGVMFAPEQPGAGNKLKADIAVSVDELRINHAKAGQLSFPVKVDGGVVNIGPLKGSVSGGDASGQAVLDGSKKNFSLTIKSLVRDMKYGELQKALFGKESASGKATLDVSLASEAASTSDLIKNLKGEAAFIAAEGDLSAGMLDLWGKSLIETMLPKFGHTETMKLNCMIADFKFADGLAKADPLFLDSDDMTIAGEGNITLSTDPQIDLLLTPKPKSPVLLSTAVAARVKGPLGNPDIGPDNLSLGKKAGGLLLGVVNPAFLVFSMTDLGLNEQHPCHKFLGAKP